MWIPTVATLIKGRCLLEDRRLLEEIQYQNLILTFFISFLEILASIETFIDAAHNGEYDKVKSMLDDGVSADCHSDNGVTALITAAINNHTKVMLLLLNRKANVNAQTRNGLTALHRAAWRGSINAIKILLHHGAKINIEDNKGRTAIDWAGNYHKEDAENLLKEHKKTLLESIGK